jgi:hypothetical protein
MSEFWEFLGWKWVACTLLAVAVAMMLSPYLRGTGFEVVLPFLIGLAGGQAGVIWNNWDE